MDGGFDSRIEAIAAETLSERAAAAGRSLDDEIAATRASAPPLTIAAKLGLSRPARDDT